MSLRSQLWPMWSTTLILQLTFTSVVVLAQSPFTEQDLFPGFDADKELYGVFDSGGAIPVTPFQNPNDAGLPLPKGNDGNLAESYLNLFISDSNAIPESDFGNMYTRYEATLNHVSQMCPKETFFAGYNPKHKQAMNELISMYSDAQDFGQLIEMSGFLKHQVHPQVWYASLMRAQLAGMPNSLAMPRPSPIYLFPSRFFPANVLNQGNTHNQGCLIVDENVGRDNGPNNKLWYFREDLQLNAHHWIWHLLYPFNSSVPLDRRGEFFYFVHHELVARYNAERLSNHMPPPVPLNFQVNSVVEEGYNAHLVDGISARPFAPRPPYQVLSEVLNATGWDTLNRLIALRDRVVDSINTGTVFRGDVDIPIHTYDNIDLLGEISEAGIRSINPAFYGTFGYHNEGHVLLASLIGKALPGTIGVMGDQSTAMRDVIFYRWHNLVDTLLQTYKATHLQPYALHDGDHPLIFNGIEITHLQVLSDDNANPNVLHTFFNKRNLFIEGGLDYNSLGYLGAPNINVCAKHLDHEEFTYQIKIDNNRQETVKAAVRIFLAPRYKHQSKLTRFKIAEQRLFFFSLDSFVAVLQPGSNIVNRKSIDSALTAPWPLSVEEIRQEILSGIPKGRASCECGYPHHLLLPKGTVEGMSYDLFVMVTDGAADQVVDPFQPVPNPHFPQCTPAHIHCGIQGRSYPDAKPMGYPFDRRPYSVPTSPGYHGKPQLKEVATIEDFVYHVPNMATTEIIIANKNVKYGPHSRYNKK